MSKWKAVKDAHGTTYEPWTDGWAVGFRVKREGKPDRFMYLNPSGDSDDGVSNVFLYEGVGGNPSEDEALLYVDVRGEAE